MGRSLSANDDTIFAVATPSGNALADVVRIAGPSAMATTTYLTPSDRHLFNEARKCWAGSYRYRSNSGCQPFLTDVFVWNHRDTFTGQPQVELTIPRCPPLLHAVMADLRGLGFRVAKPGEFSFRRFLSGKAPLSSIEQIAARIEADTPARLRHALICRADELESAVTGLRGRLLNLLSDVEASLDFATEDIRFVDHAEVQTDLAALESALQRILQRMDNRELEDRCVRVVLAGPANAGKSSLFNAILGRDQAIASPAAGTTRDTLTATLECGGIVIELVDTAGLVEAPDEIANLALCQTARARRSAQLILHCLPSDAEVRERPADFEGVDSLLVRTKCDLSPERVDVHGEWTTSIVSSDAPQRIESLRREIFSRAKSWLESESKRFESWSNFRIRETLSTAIQELAEARSQAAQGVGLEWIAESLRAALWKLGEISGDVCTEELLDRIFSRFCIGK